MAECEQPLQETDSLICRIREGVPDSRTIIPGPFGPRRLIYADYTASGRCLDFVETAIEDFVAPCYANTHSENSYTGRQTTRLREEARQAIRRSVNADHRHAVIFCGSGATAAVNKLAHVMGLRLPTSERDRAILLERIPASDRPIVFVGPFEHHSNDLPWRESLVTIQRIPLDDRGSPCLRAFARLLQAYPDRPLKIVAISAASNVTGVKTNVREFAALIHQHGGYCFVDYAAGAPYLPIDLSETMPQRADHLDAIFLSPHKFVGGPGATGVLVADRCLFSNRVPAATGGGTVGFVTPAEHRYVDEIETREEAGTPAIIGDIRAAMVMRLKSDVGHKAIAEGEHRAVEKALARWNEVPEIEILGPRSSDRLAIFSFNVRSGERLLHHSFVAALLNDLFGVQARDGCSCAGPYGHDLLQIDAALSAHYLQLIGKGLGLFKPGWVRVGFNFFFDNATIDAIIEAVAFVARRGRDLLPSYRPDLQTGLWQPVGRQRPSTPGFAELCQTWHDGRPLRTRTKRTAPSFQQCLREADALADESKVCIGFAVEIPTRAEPYRWFWLPCEAQLVSGIIQAEPVKRAHALGNH